YSQWRPSGHFRWLVRWWTEQRKASGEQPDAGRIGISIGRRRRGQRAERRPRPFDQRFAEEWAGPSIAILDRSRTERGDCTSRSEKSPRERHSRCPSEANRLEPRRTARRS